MNTDYNVIEAVAGSVHIFDFDLAEDLVRTVAPLYRDGKLTCRALVAACRLLYCDFHDLRDLTKANLLVEARSILRRGEIASQAG